MISFAGVSTQYGRQVIFVDASFEAQSGGGTDRLSKTAVHEAGHLFGLAHCDDYECVMAASHSVEWMDLKGGRLCGGCRERLVATPAASRL